MIVARQLADWMPVWTALVKLRRENRQLRRQVELACRQAAGWKVRAMLLYEITDDDKRSLIMATMHSIDSLALDDAEDEHA